MFVTYLASSEESNNFDLLIFTSLLEPKIYILILSKNYPSSLHIIIIDYSAIQDL